jgi:predicted phosphodiesterase
LRQTASASRKLTHGSASIGGATDVLVVTTARATALTLIVGHSHRSCLETS